MKSRGFTLIEVLIAVGVIGILSAIALPIYRGYVAKAEAASVTVAGLSNNFQSQLDAAESSGGSASTGNPATSSNTAPASSDTSTADTATASSNNPPVSNTTTTVSNPSTPSSETTSNSPAANTTPTRTDSPPSSSVAAPSSSSGGGSSAGGSSTPTIGVPDAYKDCNPCEIIKSETIQIAFDLSSFGTIDSTKIKAQKKSDAITGNPTGQYDASSGQYLVTFTAHSQKKKTGTLTVSADSQSVTINLKTI